ncbi:DDE superendonuclease family protein [Geobacillus kaustophilus]|uniref:DDE superendonuclease family protein n=1 Tax=Geobacillus kaustophilus TaxID=1462 RepID=A0A0D8BP06_GEOKU|nr:DDE superendonuclease family protein [Geobacillus kaustophilus]
MNRLAHHQGIHKFFTMLGLSLYFSKPVMKHLVHIVDAMMTKGFSGTLTDLHHGSFHPNHRTTLSHFFTKSPWDEETLLRKLQQWILRRVERSAKRENQPIFVSIDDTICQKTKPSPRQQTPFKGMIGTILIQRKSRSGDILLFGLWFILQPRRFPLPSAFMIRRREKAKENSRSRCFLRWMYAVPFMC